MKNAPREIPPDEIRVIRERLGLSQLEAGELLGGGPRAFTKYEAGAVKPSASVVTLLRLLEVDPSALALLPGGESRPVPSAVTGPFEVRAEHVAALNDRTFPLLIERILSAEADAHGLAQVRIHVPTRVHTPDGGEDGRITWVDGPERTRFLPSRFCVFEFKSGDIPKAKARRVPLTKSGDVKPMVRSGLKADATYVVLCAHAYVQKDVDARASRIRKALRDAGLDLEDSRVELHDAEQIATWTNLYPSVSTWLKEQVQPGTVGPFRTWGHWAQRAEHSVSLWVDDERLPELRARVRGAAVVPKSTLRIVGPSGIGKSRLAMEAFRPTVDEEQAGRCLSHLVLYADLSEVSPETIHATVQTLADSRQRALVIVDRCPVESHRILTGMVSQASSRLSLITVDVEVPDGTLDRSTLRLADAPPSVTEAIVDRDLPNVPSMDRRRIAQFSRGYPEIAIRVARAWAESRPIPHATDDDLVDTFVLGRTSRERDTLLKAATLLATFGVVHLEDSGSDQLCELASRGRGLSADDLYAAFGTLVARGVAHRRGRAVVLQPRPIAMHLTERQWGEWTPATREEVLSGDGNLELKVMAARQLAWLNTTECPRGVVEHVCRPGGPFDGFEGLTRSGHAEVLSFLAEVDSGLVAGQLGRSFDAVEDLRTIEGDARRDLVWALEKVAFRADTFEEGAHLLLRLALAENEEWGNNATGQFKGLFPLLLADTEADGRARLPVLDAAAAANDPKKHEIVVEALIEATAVDHHSRFLGPETHGSRPALESWHPASHDEAVAYVTGCVTRLVDFAVREDALGRAARTGLARNVRGLLGRGFVDAVETAVKRVRGVVGFWPEPLEGLGHFLTFDVRDPGSNAARRVRALIDDLEPEALEERVRLIVTEMPYDYPCGEELDFDERDRRQRDAVREVAAELSANPEVLARVLPQLSRGQQRQVHVLGRDLTALLDSPSEWLERVVAAFRQAPEEERNCDLLSAYVAGMAQAHPEAAEAFKQRAAQSPELAPVLPLICFRLGVTPSDIPRVVGALEAGLLAPSRLMQWTVGRALDGLPVAAVAPLFDAMLAHSADAFAVAVDLMGMYARGDADKFNGLGPQVRNAAECVTRWNESRPHPMAIHHVSQLMSRMLERGRGDPHARAVALALARAVVDVDDADDWFGESLVSLLLSNFPEIAWPLVGQAIVADPSRAWTMESVLGGQIGFDREPDAVLLHLPQDTLFAWCHAHPDRAPAFVAKVVPPLTSYRHDAAGRSLHPVLVRLLDEFGDRDDVLQGIADRMHTFGWSGSLASYFALYEEPLRPLLDHPQAKVRHWAKATLRGLRASIERARDQDEESAARWEV